MGWLRSYALAFARLLGSHSEINRALHAHTMAKTLKESGARIFRSGSLRLRGKTDLNSTKGRKAAGGVKPSYRSIL